jgi:hypothetical protein
MISSAIAKLIRGAVDDGVMVKPSTDTVKLSANALPCVVYTLLYKTRRYCDGDEGPVNIRLTQSRFQIDVFAASMTAAEAIANAITADQSGDGLDGYQGDVDADSSVTRIERIYFDDGDSFQRLERIEGEQNSIARYSLDLIAEFRGN